MYIRKRQQFDSDALSHSATTAGYTPLFSTFLNENKLDAVKILLPRARGEIS